MVGLSESGEAFVANVISITIKTEAVFTDNMPLERFVRSFIKKSRRERLRAPRRVFYSEYPKEKIAL